MDVASELEAKSRVHQVTALEGCTVNKTHRRMITAAAFAAAVVGSTPMMATAQGRNSQRNPIFIAVTFHSPANDAKLGVDVAEGLRQRMMKLFPQTPLRPGALRVVTREQINAQLTAAGYPADSAITTTDLRDLGKNIGADETLEGTATRTAEGIKVQAKFYSLNNVLAPEVLPTVVDKDAGGAGRQLADLYARARKELPDYNNCRNGLINQQVDQAVTAAKAAMQQYDKGVLPRACLMNAYFKLAQGNKMPMDSVIKVGQDILTIDPDNELAIGQLADAYMVKGDTTKSMEMNLKLYRLNPSNVEQAKTIIGLVASLGAPEKAVPIVKDLLATNPGDPAILETYWKLLQATKDWKQAIAIGEEMVKFDSSKADTTFYNRQIASAIADSQPQLVLQYLAKATAKYPKNTHYLLGYSQELRRQGQLQQALDVAKKAIVIDPAVPQGYATVLSLYAALGQSDSAMAFAKLALAAHADRDAVGGALLTLLKPSLAKAQASGARPDMEEFYRMAATVDSIIPQQSTAFYMSFAAYSIAASMLQDVAGESKDRPKACADIKRASELATVVDLNMARGGRENPANAAAILNALNTQIKPYIETTKKQLACK
jgi:tetratricopeptide (TPR) repeat protein